VAEGDTILRAARRIGRALEGQRVEVGAPNPRGRAAGVARLDGKVLDRVSARGKHLLLGFGDTVLHSHLGMSGSWHVYERGTAWRKPPNAAWAVLRGESAEAVQFGGPTLRVLLSAPERSVGDALLDQALVAGIGNVFKSETCFAARQGPWQPVADLPEGQLRRVVETAHELMRDAVDHGRHDRAVYRRAGRPCPNCATPIASRGQGDANRTTYWCPVCQAPAPASRLPSPRRG
jgi:endonuclease-8